MTDPRLFYPIPPIVSNTTTTIKPQNQQNTTVQPKIDFKSVLNNEIKQVKFSQHALQRLDSRNIILDEQQIEKLQQAVDKATQKGSRESLVLMDNQLAFVVSVRNRTVITAMDGNSIKDNIFTNIDSAIVI